MINMQAQGLVKDSIQASPLWDHPHLQRLPELTVALMQDTQHLVVNVASKQLHLQAKEDGKPSLQQEQKRQAKVTPTWDQMFLLGVLGLTQALMQDMKHPMVNGASIQMHQQAKDDKRNP
jgi:hypothetical protein